MLITNKLSFYRYEGSLNFPPCNTGYTNIVMEHIGSIGSTNLSLLKKYLGDNIRQIQQTGSRKVFYSTGRDIVTRERKVEVTDDRFLRCVRKKDITPTTSPAGTNPSNFVGCFSDKMS